MWTDPRDEGRLPDVYLAMGQTAENLAQICNVSREEMDEFGVRSQNLAEKAIADGFWAREITPVTLPDGTVVSTDDGPRPGVTLEAVAGLKPVFRPDGRVTAGNCCPLNDGAAAVVLMSAAKAEALGITPLARIISTGVTAMSPEIMGIGPVEASRQALARAGMTIDDVDLVEINEAFAAQVIPSYQQLGIPIEKLNVNGGAIAVGHPFGMTGARITGTLLNSLHWHDKHDRPGDDVRRRRPGHGHGHRAPQLEVNRLGRCFPNRESTSRDLERAGRGEDGLGGGAQDLLRRAGQHQVGGEHPDLVGQGSRRAPAAARAGAGAPPRRPRRRPAAGRGRTRGRPARRRGPPAGAPVADPGHETGDGRAPGAAARQVCVRAGS